MKTSRRIALSGIASALSTMFLIVSVYIPLMDMSCMVLASLSLLIPIAKNDYFGASLAYLSASILGLLTTGNVLGILPYVIFFGLHPILVSLVIKWHLPVILQLVIKLVFANLAIFLAWRFLGLVLVISEFEFPYWLIALVGSLGFILYDWLIVRLKMIFNYYIDKFVKGKGRKV